MPFELFDPKAEFVVRCGALPHWYQPGATYFVTFRSADSVPQELSRKWRVRREGWLKRRGIDPHASDWKLRLRSEPEIEQAFHAEFVPEFMSWLDHGYGECAQESVECRDCRR